MKKKNTPKFDFCVTNHGSIVLVTPVSGAAKIWLDEHISEESQYFGRSLVVEPRYIEHLLQGIIDEGFSVEA